MAHLLARTCLSLAHAFGPTDRRAACGFFKATPAEYAAAFGYLDGVQADIACADWQARPTPRIYTSPGPPIPLTMVMSQATMAPVGPLILSRTLSQLLDGLNKLIDDNKLGAPLYKGFDFKAGCTS